MRIQLDCFGMTDQGLRRTSNQDQFLVADLAKAMKVNYSSLALDDGQTLLGGIHGQVFIVADGMGGHKGGERASHIALNTMMSYILDIMPWFYRPSEATSEAVDQELLTALDRCQMRIQRDGLRNADRSSMGTTFTMAWLIWPNLHIVHVGDSRAYLCRGDEIRQLTVDQTVAEKLAEAHPSKRSELERSVWSHALWSFLGVDTERMQAELCRETLEPGDTLLLCTDGLTGKIEDGELLGRLQASSAAKDACRSLVDLALERGGADNITMVVARALAVEDEPKPPTSTGDTSVNNAPVPAAIQQSTPTHL